MWGHRCCAPTPPPAHPQLPRPLRAPHGSAQKTPFYYCCGIFFPFSSPFPLFPLLPPSFFFSSIFPFFLPFLFSPFFSPQLSAQRRAEAERTPADPALISAENAFIFVPFFPLFPPFPLSVFLSISFHFPFVFPFFPSFSPLFPPLSLLPPPFPFPFSPLFLFFPLSFPSFYFPQQSRISRPSAGLKHYDPPPSPAPIRKEIAFLFSFPLSPLPFLPPPTPFFILLFSFHLFSLFLFFLSFCLFVSPTKRSSLGPAPGSAPPQPHSEPPIGSLRPIFAPLPGYIPVSPVLGAPRSDTSLFPGAVGCSPGLGGRGRKG